MTGYQYTPWIWPVVASAAFNAALSLYLWRRRQVPGALPLALAVFVVALWCVTDAGEITATQVASKQLWFLVRDALALPGVTLSVWFALEYAGLQRWLTRPVVALLAGAVIALVPLYLVDGGRLLWSRLWLDGSMRGDLAPLGAAFGVYGFGISLLATAILLLLFIRSPAHRSPVALIVLGQIGLRVAYPLGALNIADVPNLATMDLAVDFASLMYVIALFRFRLFDLVPAARETILERLPDAMLVLDSKDRVADLNGAAARLLGLPRDRALGQPVASTLEAFPDLARCIGTAAADAPGEASFETAMGTRTCEVNSTPLGDWQGAPIGRLVLLHDTTVLRAAEARLLEQERALTAARERERLARDLHDTLGQVLGYLGLQAAAIRKLASDGRLDDADERLVRVAAIAADSQSDVRRTIAELASSPGQVGDFVASLRARLDASRRDYGIETSLAIAPSMEGTHVQPVAASHLLRIVDEAITNAIRHGAAREARVSLARDDSSLSLSIEDDGAGFETAAVPALADGRYGLRFMRERAAELGGELELTSAPGRGTRVAIRVPLQANQGVTIQ